MAAKATFVCAHGAGGHKDDRMMRRFAAALEPHGFDVRRFDFPYVQKGSRRIDAVPVLMQAFKAEVGKAGRGRALILGGRSMGGRIASMLAAEGFSCDGLLLAAYPLHPAGKPEMLRDAHLPAIRCPVLFISGTRDALCTKALMDRALERMTAPATLHWIEGGDHSFRVLKSSGRTEADVDREIGEAAGRWLEKIAVRP